jgi:hypothetical protein
MARVKQGPDQAKPDVAVGTADEDMHARILAWLEKFAAANFRKFIFSKNVVQDFSPTAKRDANEPPRNARTD